MLMLLLITPLRYYCFLSVFFADFLHADADFFHITPPVEYCHAFSLIIYYFRDADALILRR